MYSHSVNVRLLATLWTIACQAPLSMGFWRKEYWKWLPCPPPGNLLDPWIEPKFPVSPASQGDSLPAEPSWKSDIAKCLQGMKASSVKNHTDLSQYVCKEVRSSWITRTVHSHRLLEGFLVEERHSLAFRIQRNLNYETGLWLWNRDLKLGLPSPLQIKDNTQP